MEGSILNNFFSPKSIAVIGASHRKEKLGFLVYENIKKYGFRGKLYGVNVKGGKIGDEKLYKSIKEITQKVDLAVVVVPSRVVPIVLKEIGEKGVNSAIIISAGFSEIGSEGRKLETLTSEIAKTYGIRVLGPNCLGIIDSWSKMNASFAQTMPDPMNISLFSQSGAICTAILDWANKNEIGFSRFVSLGNKLDIDENDILNFLYHDTKTKIVLGYLESIHDGRTFMENARRLSLKKPFIAVKSGKTRAGAKTISSHTGSIAGSDLVVETALKQCGVVQADSLEDLFDLAKIFSFAPTMKGNAVAVISNAGGPAVMTADAVDKSALKLAVLDTKTKKILEEHLPSEAAKENPIDVLGDALADRYMLALEEVLKDDNVNGVVIILTPQVMTEVKKTAKIIVDAKKHRKPMAVCFMGGEKVEEGIKILNEKEVAAYDFPERAVKALEALYKYHRFVIDSASVSVKAGNIKHDGQKATKIIKKALARKTRYLTEGKDGAFDVFDAYGIETVKRAYTLGWEDLKRKATAIRYPVVLKTAASGILHRTDIGGVVTDIQGKKELATAYKSISASIKKEFNHADSEAMSIYRMEEEGIEIFLGAKRDPNFGPLIIFGMGGIFVEVIKDFSYRIAPVSHKEAIKMISELKSSKILRGYRGGPMCALEKIAHSIIGLSQLMIDNPEIKEIDINPLKVTDKKCVALDGKIILDI